MVDATGLLAWDLATPEVMAVIAIVGVALLGSAWFGVKFWLASTRPPNIKEVRTPMLDRLNRKALETMGNEEENEEDMPEALKKVLDDTGTK